MAAIRVTRINHVAVPIADRRKALPFYRDLLGLKVIPSMVDSPNVTWVQLADVVVCHRLPGWCNWFRRRARDTPG